MKKIKAWAIVGPTDHEIDGIFIKEADGYVEMIFEKKKCAIAALKGFRLGWEKVVPVLISFPKSNKPKKK